MKKTYLYLTLLIVVLFTACTDDIGLNVAPPQSNPQETAQTVDGFKFALGNVVKAPIVLTKAELAESKLFETILTTATPQLAEGAVVKFLLEASDTKDFIKVVELPSVSGNNTASVSAVDLNEAVKSLYGKAPNPRELYLRALYFIVDGTGSVMMPTPVVLGPITVTPVAPIIETEYYIIGSLNGWNISDLSNYKFNHSGGDVYVNSIFTILVNLTEDATYWKVVPKSSKEAASWDGVLGNAAMDGNTALTGELLIGGGAMKIEQPGWAKITLDMMEGTYSVELIGVMNLKLYVPGSHQGWSPGSAPIVYNRNFDMKYEGYVNFSANDLFKFTSDPDWDHTNYGDGGNGTLSTTGDNLTVAEAGYYKLNVDLSGSPFTYTKVKTDWGLIGDATVGGWDNSTPMTYNPDTKVWTVTTTLTAGKAFKFRANNGWDINLGGNQSNLSYGGDNIQVATDGTYLVTLDLSNPEAYKCSVVKQ